MRSANRRADVSDFSQPPNGRSKGNGCAPKETAAATADFWAIPAATVSARSGSTSARHRVVAQLVEDAPQRPFGAEDHRLAAEDAQADVGHGVERVPGVGRLHQQRGRQRPRPGRALPHARIGLGLDGRRVEPPAQHRADVDPGERVPAGRDLVDVLARIDPEEGPPRRVRRRQRHQRGAGRLVVGHRPRVDPRDDHRPRRQQRQRIGVEIDLQVPFDIGGIPRRRAGERGRGERAAEEPGAETKSALHAVAYEPSTRKNFVWRFTSSSAVTTLRSVAWPTISAKKVYIQPSPAGRDWILVMLISRSAN